MTNNPLVEALLPCPFCGGEAVVDDHSSSYRPDAPPLWYVGCGNDDCHVQIDRATQDKDRAIAAWNTRTALASSGNATGDDKGLVERQDRVSRYLANEAAARKALATHPDKTAARLRAWQQGQGEWFSDTLLEIVAEFIAFEDRLTALSSGNEVAKVVGWLLSLDRDEWYPSDVADAIARGDHLASDAAPLTGG